MARMSAISRPITDPTRRQVFNKTIDGSGDFQAETFPTAFPVGSQITLVATCQDHANVPYFISIRNITVTGFDFKGSNHDGATHTGPEIVGFVAERRD